MRSKSLEQQSTPDLTQRVSLPQAYAQLAEMLNMPMTDAQALAWTRLQLAMSVPQPHINRDQLIDSFADLDTVLFNGTLTGRVKVMWKRLLNFSGLMLRGQCHPAAITWRGVTKCEIWLKLDLLDMEDGADVWGTLIHEILHAYLDLHTRLSSTFRSHHGDVFRQTCTYIEDQLGFPGLEWSNLGS